jgi:hypothetical protein
VVYLVIRQTTVCSKANVTNITEVLDRKRRLVRKGADSDLIRGDVVDVSALPTHERRRDRRGLLMAQRALLNEPAFLKAPTAASYVRADPARVADGVLYSRRQNDLVRQHCDTCGPISVTGPVIGSICNSYSEPLRERQSTMIDTDNIACES